MSTKPQKTVISSPIKPPTGGQRPQSSSNLIQKRHHTGNLQGHHVIPQSRQPPGIGSLKSSMPKQRSSTNLDYFTSSPPKTGILTEKGRYGKTDPVKGLKSTTNKDSGSPNIFSSGQHPSSPVPNRIIPPSHVQIRTTSITKTTSPSKHMIPNSSNTIAVGQKSERKSIQKKPSATVIKQSPNQKVIRSVPVHMQKASAQASPNKASPQLQRFLSNQNAPVIKSRGGNNNKQQAVKVNFTSSVSPHKQVQFQQHQKKKEDEDTPCNNYFQINLSDMAESLESKTDENDNNLRLPIQPVNQSENIELSPQVTKHKITKAGISLSNSKPRKTTTYVTQKPIPEAQSPQSPDTIVVQSMKKRRSDYLTKNNNQNVSNAYEEEAVPMCPNKKSSVASPARTQPDNVAVFEVNLDSNDSQVEIVASQEEDKPKRQIEPSDLLNLKKTELLSSNVSDGTSTIKEEKPQAVIEIQSEDFKVEIKQQSSSRQPKIDPILSVEPINSAGLETPAYPDENYISNPAPEKEKPFAEEKHLPKVELRPSLLSSEEQPQKPKKERKSRQQRALNSKASQESISPKIVVKSQSDKYIDMNRDNLFEYEINEIKPLEKVYFDGQITNRLTSELELFRGKEEEIIKDFDDEEGYYNIVLNDHINYRYEIIKILGKGSFAQVVMAVDHKDNRTVALKVTRNTEIDHKFAQSEQRLLQYLMEEDPDCKHNIIRLYDTFEFRSHILLDSDLFEYLKEKDFMGMSTGEIKKIAKQLLETLAFLEKRKIIHCDLKPENILLEDRDNMKIKLVDYGSGCFVDEQVYTYVQSRFYRAPEVILRLAYTEKVDMWSFGCILAELYTGDPLFPGNNEQEQIEYIMEICDIFPTSLVEFSRKRDYYFDEDFSPFLIEDANDGILRIPGSRALKNAVNCSDDEFIDLIDVSYAWSYLQQKCLQVDPHHRLSASEALNHPWFVSVGTELSRQPTQHNVQPRQREEVINAQEEQSPIKVIKDKIKKSYTKVVDTKQVSNFDNDDVLSDSPPKFGAKAQSEHTRQAAVRKGGSQAQTDKPAEETPNELDKIFEDQSQGNSFPSPSKKEK